MAVRTFQVNMDKLFVSLSVLFAVALYMALSQGTCTSLSLCLFYLSLLCMLCDIICLSVSVCLSLSVCLSVSVSVSFVVALYVT